VWEICVFSLRWVVGGGLRRAPYRLIAPYYYIRESNHFQFNPCFTEQGSLCSLPAKPVPLLKLSAILFLLLPLMFVLLLAMIAFATLVIVVIKLSVTASFTARALRPLHPLYFCFAAGRGPALSHSCYWSTGSLASQWPAAL